jgi:hypothetical protein
LKQASLVLLAILLVTAVSAFAQSGDISFGMSTVTSPGTSNADPNSGFLVAPSIRGGSYLSFTGDFLLRHSLGVGGEISWRASQGLYGGYQPYRPLFYDVFGVYAPKFNKYAGASLLAGIGAESNRFYTGQITCSGFSGSCTNYTSSNHFMGVFGGGLKLYPKGNFFIEPEVRLYLVHNNVEFSSSRMVRSGVSIGYSFGRTD